MLWSQAFVFLRVDEPLDLLRHPAGVVDLEVLDQPLDQAQLVVRVDDLEILRQIGLAPVSPQHAMREAVKGADPEMLYGQIQQRLDTAAHLRGGLVRERYREQAIWRDLLDFDQPGGAMHEHARLAAAGAGYDERGFGRCSNGLALRVV